MSRAQTAGTQRLTRSHQNDQDLATTGKTRSTTAADSSTAGSRGKSTTSTLRESRATIDNVAKAKAWLIKDKLLIEGESMSPAALSQALMWLAAGDHSTAEHLVDGIRSVALCLEEWDRETAVEETLKASTVMLLEETKKEIKRIVEEVASEVKSSMNQTEGRAGGRNWAEDVEEEFSQRNTIQDIAKAIPSYAQVLANEWRKDANKKEDRRHHDYMAKEALRRRRVLIDGLEGVQSATGI